MANGTCFNRRSEKGAIRVMRNWGIIFIIAALLALNCAAQTSSAKGGVDPLKAATKPLTPKTPITTGKTWAGPSDAVNTRRTNDELTRLEKQTLSTTSPVSTSKKTHNPGNTRTAPVKTSTAAPSSGSGINATYQKPRIPQK
ncbi:MAG TPA: hypothetical protein VGG14_10450 [Candidatus Sulfotelmatobacter sp.]